jgi:hypothetical protein
MATVHNNASVIKGLVFAVLFVFGVVAWCYKDDISNHFNKKADNGDLVAGGTTANQKGKPAPIPPAEPKPAPGKQASAGGSHAGGIVIRQVCANGKETVTNSTGHANASITGNVRIEQVCGNSNYVPRAVAKNNHVPSKGKNVASSSPTASAQASLVAHDKCTFTDQFTGKVQNLENENENELRVSAKIGKECSKARKTLEEKYVSQGARVVSADPY